MAVSSSLMLVGFICSLFQTWLPPVDPTLCDLHLSTPLISVHVSRNISVSSQKNNSSFTLLKEYVLDFVLKFFERLKIHVLYKVNSHIL